MKNIWRAIQLVPEYPRRIAGVLTVGAVLGTIGAGTPYIYKAIVDVVAHLFAGRTTAAEAGRHVATLLATFFALRAGVVLFTALQHKQADDLWLHTVSTFRQRVFEKMTRLSIDYFEKTRAGEVMDRFGAITTITMWLNGLTEGTVANLLQMLFSLVVLVAKAPKVGALMTAVLAFNFYVSYRTVGWTKPYRRGWQAAAGRLAGLLGEMIANIATVRSFGGEGAVKQKYDATQAEWKVVRGGLHRVQWRSGLALNVVNTLGVFVVVLIVARGALAGRFTSGDILLVLTLAQNLINAVGPIARQINQMSDIDTTAERLVELLEVPGEVADVPNARELDDLRTIEFDRVTFAYPGKDAPSLRDISFKLDARETLALVGPSGGGKTTLVKLLLRFYDPTAGRILINGRDLREYRARSVRAKLGVVLQDVALFNESIGDNIALVRPGATDDDVRAAARAAHADDFIQRLPEGYGTLVGERGIKLSGGEKQRVAIARAILKEPQLIILDEATSALDSESEHAVQQGLERLLRGRGSVIIAHRLSTIVNADHILVLQAGAVVESGRHAQLAAQPGGLYARLYRLQSRGRLGDGAHAASAAS